MKELEIDFSSEESIKAGFDKIAEKLFREYILKVNESNYRLLDIEFYYYSIKTYEDVYSHKSKHQLTSGKWYFHGSGIDLTFGNDKNYGGILIRAIGKLSDRAEGNKYFLEEEIHGPQNVKRELCANFFNVFEDKANFFNLIKIEESGMKRLFIQPDYIIKSARINLNSAKESKQKFHDAKLRYVIFPKLKLKDKTQIAESMREQFNLTEAEVNKELGSKFL